MNCPNEYLIAEYLEGICAPRIQQRLTEHITGCARCQQEISALQQTTRMLHDLPTPVIPNDLWSATAARITSTQLRTISPWWWRTLAGVGLAASLLVGMLVTRPHPSLPDASAAASSYLSMHQLLSARDTFSDRASLGVSLISNQGHK